ncbi:MAG: DNA polymerase III subunit beta [Eubacterium sp.]|nr:DNA polymerase III subunit beta [Eubacterium sp.]
MKLIFSKTDLMKSINIALRAVSSKTTVPILKNILIDARGDEIKFLTNDMELAIETRVLGSIIEKGMIAIEARTFSEVVRKLPDGLISIETNERMVATITCEKIIFTLPGLDGDDFPEMPQISRDYSLGISQFTLKEMIRQTIFSLNMNENNKLMTGELFEIKDNALRMIALDGHRIAIRKLALGGNYENRKCIIPGKTLNEISRILSDNLEDQVEIYLSDNHVLFLFDETSVYTRLVDGEYFRIDNMISREYQTSVVVNRKEFINCLDRSGLLIKEGDNRPIILNIIDGFIELNIQSSYGSLSEDIDVEKEGKDLKIGFNPKFVGDALKVIDEDDVHIYFVNGKAPGYIKDEEENYIYMILPVNVL